ncbi:1-phosphofructokinase family hexose kinase [Paenibacillus sp. TRM 82003]|nr:1-phosphofructokinase family hexose kinase [Paenibacillus sp. TRM 82003]
MSWGRREGVATVTLNAAIDKSYMVPSFVLGRAARIREMNVYPGGKGINVARGVRQLGESAVALGFVAGCNGSYIRQSLTEQGIAHDFVDIPGESRLCLNILHDDGLSTELIEPGPSVDGAALARLERRVRRAAELAAVVVISGSVLEGTPRDYYERLIRLVREAGAAAYVDASGAALAAAVEAKPDFVKPNEAEMAALLERPASSEAELAAGARALVRRGVGMAAVTLGAAGAFVFVPGTAYRVRVPRLDVVSAVGCGDAFVAGMAVGLLRRLPNAERIRLAAAAACANALHREAGRIDASTLKRMLPLIEVDEMG